MSPSVEVVGSGPWSGLSPFARPGPTLEIALVLRVEFAHALGPFIASREDGMDARRPEWTILRRTSRSGCLTLELEDGITAAKGRFLVLV
jgi:hypothetical protein